LAEALLVSVELPAAAAFADFPFAYLRDIAWRGFPFAFAGVALFQFILGAARGRRRGMFIGPGFTLAAGLLFWIRQRAHLQFNQRPSILYVQD
jgi:hypothetical protein